MKLKTATSCAAIMSVASGPVSAESRAALVDSSLGSSSAQSLAGRGVGAKASLSLRFGAKRAAETLRLGLAAGPVMRFTVSSAGDSRSVMSNLLGVSVNPGYSTTFTLAGAEVGRHATRLGAAEDEAAGKRLSGSSTLGWVAIGVGVVVVGVVALAVACTDTDLNCLNSD